MLDSGSHIGSHVGGHFDLSYISFMSNGVLNAVKSFSTHKRPNDQTNIDY